ncbi:MAG: hypothetical protein BBJ57_02055 [Desulfobacterales bacterium PC51MH44]|nr:MAG: hypothetical protein BBJ57_02055 [Desulfobacterales bacterium PC51MH44]
MSEEKAAQKTVRLSEMAGSSKSVLQARYDAAQTTDQNSRHWANAGMVGMTADDRNNNQVRNILKSRSRYEYDNSGYVKRIINKTSREIVGKSIKVNVESTNKAFNTAVEKAIREWKRKIKLEAKLRTIAKDKIRDGEGVALPIRNTALGDGVQLDLLPITCDRITSTTLDSSANNVDGVLLNSMGIVNGFEIADRSDVQSTILNTETTKYSVDDVYFWYEQEYAEQHRGIPELTSTLQLNADSRRYRKSVGDTAEMQTNFAMVLEQEVVNPDQTPCSAMDTIDLEPRTMTVLPPNAKLNSMQPGQPVDTYKEYTNTVLQETSAPSIMPHNMVIGSSADMNYSSARFDYYIMFGKDRDILREDMENEILNDFIMRFILEWAALNRRSIPRNMRVTFAYELDKYINPLQEAKADKTRLEPMEDGVRMQSLKSYHSLRGEDWQEETDQCILEDIYIKNQREKAGLTDTDTGGDTDE